MTEYLFCCFYSYNEDRQQGKVSNNSNKQGINQIKSISSYFLV